MVNAKLLESQLEEIHSVVELKVQLFNEEWVEDVWRCGELKTIASWLLQEGQSQRNIIKTIVGLYLDGATDVEAIQNIGNGEYEEFTKQLSCRGVPTSISGLLYNKYILPQDDEEGDKQQEGGDKQSSRRRNIGALFSRTYPIYYKESFRDLESQSAVKLPAIYDTKMATSMPIEKEIDASLLFGLERTLFSALNLGWIVTFIGIGLMSVGASDNKTPDTLGAVLISCGIIHSLGSWALHCARVRALKSGKPMGIKASLIWTFFLTSLLVFGTIFELHYGRIYPFLERAKAVEVTTANL